MKFWLLLSHAYPVKDVSLSCGPPVRICTGSSAGAWLGQVTQSGQVIFRTAEHPTQCINWGELPCRDQLWPGGRLSVAVSWAGRENCIECHLFLSAVFPSPLYYYHHHHPLLLTICGFFCFVSIIKTFLSQSMNFTLFLILLPIPLWRRWSEWAGAWCLIASLG